MTRYVAHITIEAETPLKVGSNSSDFIQDSPIQRDFNNLPIILGTSLAGVLRKAFKDSVDKESLVNDIFGNENGSKIIISNALLLNENEEVSEALLLEKSDFLKIFETLPIREHTAITAKGVAKEHSKFDEEVLYKGSRFKFSLELIEENEEVFTKVLSLLLSTSFRVGGGSTKGFGKIKVVEIKTDKFNRDSYLGYSSSLNYTLSKSYEIKTTNSSKHFLYQLRITPDDFFMFGSSFGDEDADLTPVYEQVVDYKAKKLTEKMILIPASSIKGALAHRTTYHFNLNNKFFIGNDGARESIKELFGAAKQSEENLGEKGKILISDCFKEDNGSTKIFDHVSIDRFTGGAIDGALFQEKTVADTREYTIEILLEKSVADEYREAFELALKDITTGMLSLGGMTTKGHGIFSGEVLRDGETI